MISTKPKFSKSIFGILIAILAVWVFADSATAKQKVVLVTGEMMTVDQARVEDGRVWISLNGLDLSIDEKEVLRIESDGARPIIVHDSPPAPQPQTERPESKPPDPARLASLQQPVAETPINKTPTSNPVRSGSRPKSVADRPSESPEPPNISHMAAQVTALLQPDGFGGMKWGDRRESRPGLKRLYKDSELPDVIEYVHPDDSLQLGPDSKEALIKYAFWKDRLYMVTLWVPGPEAYQSIREAMVIHFGHGILKPGDRQIYYWIDDQADRMIEYLEDKDLGLLWMRSREINNQYQLARLRIPIRAGQSIVSGKAQ